VPRAPAPIAAAPLKRRDQPAGRDASPTAPITPASRIVHLDRIVDLRREHTAERTVVVRDRPITVRQTERERVVTTLPPAATPRREIARAAVAATQARQAPPAAAPGPVQVRIGRVELTVTAPPAPPAPAAPAGWRAPAAPGHPDLLAAHRQHLPRSVS
jgi:hypothetical protein